MHRRGRHWAFSLAPALLLASAPSVDAQIYVCKDASGRTITADRPIAECANRTMRELDRNGLTRREISAPLTTEQKHAQQALDEKQRIAAIAAEEQRLYDRALTTRYRSEADIGAARQHALDLLAEQMRIDTNALAREMKEMKAAELPVAAPGKKSGSAADRERLTDATHAVAVRLTSIEQRETEVERTNQKYDQSLKRLREIHDSDTTGRASSR